MSITGDQKPVYLIAVPTPEGDEGWLTVAVDGERVAVAFDSREDAEAYARESVGGADVFEIVEYARVPEPSEE